VAAEKRPRVPGERGVTLVEILVAIFILLVAVLGTIAVLYAGLRPSARTVESNAFASLVPPLRAKIEEKLRQPDETILWPIPVPSAEWPRLPDPGGEWHLLVTDIPQGYRAAFRWQEHPGRSEPTPDPACERLYLLTIRIDRVRDDDVLRSFEFTSFLEDR